MNKKEIIFKIFLIVCFAVAMGYFEAVVVVYLRAILQKLPYITEPIQQVATKLANEPLYLVEQFRAILNTAIYVRWFNKKTMSQREKLLEKKRRLLYSESEAQKIVPLLLEYYQDPE